MKYIINVLKFIKWAIVFIAEFIWALLTAGIEFIFVPSTRKAILTDIKLFLSIPYWILFNKSKKWTDNHDQK